MIKTIEIAPAIYAKELAKHIWETYGTIELNFPYNPPALVISTEDDLYDTIKAFMLRE